MRPHLRTHVDRTLARAGLEVLESRCLFADGTAWQPLTLQFAGPTSDEQASSPNPFLDYRLNVTFTHSSGTSYTVPGYFDGNGNGGPSGNVWRTKFTPDRAGDWSWSASFRAGTNVAIDLNANAGSPTSFNGQSGSLDIAAPNLNAPGFLGRGMLKYAGSHYFKTLDGRPWVKGGANSPENFLGYEGFDNTPLGEHTYSAHVDDWNAGDPDWNNGAGKGIIGAINYLADTGINSIYLLPMNIGGDGKDTWPFAGPIDESGDPDNGNLHYDVSKLAQWETVFSHAQAKGLMLHMVLMEAEGENKEELDEGTLGVERMLFYREMVARFGHHNAVQWNISEEYNYKMPLSPDAIKSFAGYLQSVDPYDHPITVHNYSGVNAFDPFLGDSRFSATSFQTSGSDGGKGDTIEAYRTKSTAAGRPVVVMLDEARGVTTSNLTMQRKDILWPTLLSGGGVEFYMGSEDASLEDFHKYDALYTWTGYALKFMNEELPYDQMSPADNLLSGETSDLGQVFAKSGTIYAAYIPNASSTGSIDLTAATGEVILRWFNPRTGEFVGVGTSLNGGGVRALGAPPGGSTSDDWLALLTRTGGSVEEPPPDPDPVGGEAPKNLAIALNHDDYVRLTWSNGEYPSRSTLIVERANLTAGTGYVTIASLRTSRISHTDDEVQPGVRYGYRIRAVTGDGVVGPYSSAVSITTPGGGPVVVAPAAPSGLTATASGQDRINLAWVDNASDEDTYVVERAAAANGPWTVRATLNANVTSFADTGLNASTTYVYRVRALRDDGMASTYSATAWATTAAPTSPTFGIARLVLVDAETGDDLLVLADGMTLSVATLGTRKWNVRAEVMGAVESVRFALNDDSDYRTENEPIYTLAGDSDGAYRTWSPSNGLQTLAVTAYTKDRAAGTASEAFIVSFNVTA